MTGVEYTRGKCHARERSREYKIVNFVKRIY